MASINGISVKNVRTMKVDLDMFPNAETDRITSCKVYNGKKAIYEYSQDMHGGCDNLNSIIIKDKYGNYVKVDNNGALNIAFSRWISAIENGKYLDECSFIHDIIALADVEKKYSRYLLQEDACTVFCAFVLGWGMPICKAVKGRKNFTQAIKEEMEDFALKECKKFGNFIRPTVVFFSFHNVDDFNVTVGTERDGEFYMKQKEIQKEQERKQREVEELQRQVEKEKIESNKRYVKEEVKGKPEVKITDKVSKKSVIVPVFAANEVLRALVELQDN